MNRMQLKRCADILRIAQLNLADRSVEYHQYLIVSIVDAIQAGVVQDAGNDEARN